MAIQLRMDVTLSLAPSQEKKGCLNQFSVIGKSVPSMKFARLISHSATFCIELSRKRKINKARGTNEPEENPIIAKTNNPTRIGSEAKTYRTSLTRLANKLVTDFMALILD